MAAEIPEATEIQTYRIRKRTVQLLNPGLHRLTSKFFIGCWQITAVSICFCVLLQPKSYHAFRQRTDFKPERVLLLFPHRKACFPVCGQKAF